LLLSAGVISALADTDWHAMQRVLLLAWAYAL